MPSGKPDKSVLEGSKSPIEFFSGDTYEGKFKANKFHGEGKVEWEDGIVWYGEFKKDVLVINYNE